jgi:hypothetical protein
MEARRRHRLEIAKHVRYACAASTGAASPVEGNVSTPDGAERREQDTARVGCLEAIGRWAVGRMRGMTRSNSTRPAHQAVGIGGSCGVAVSECATATDRACVRKEVTRATGFTSLFGRPVAAKTPTGRLMAANASITARTEELEQRVAEHRQMATNLLKEGKKTAALRALKRSKQYEAQAANLAAASVAVQRQADMLEEADLQQEVAKALEQGVKENKKVKSAFSRIEAVADDAHEMSDNVDEVHQLLAGLAENLNETSSLDDDELLAELQQMVEVESTGTEPRSVPTVKDARAEGSTEAVRVQAFPSAPTTVIGKPTTERSVLLTSTATA